MRLFPLFNSILKTALDADGKKIVNLGSPTQDSDAATKKYVDDNQQTIVLDDTVTETSSNGVKSSGIWSWVKSLLPQWLTSDYAEPATVASVEAKADQSALNTVADKAEAAHHVATGMASTVYSHVENRSNPHAVTAAQVGAAPLVTDSSGNKTAVTIGSRRRESAVGPYSLANGDEVSANGIGTHAEGLLTTALGEYSHASGVKSLTGTGSAYAFAWSGDETSPSPYNSHGKGTFNINPVGGTEGFYLGEQTLAQVIAAAIAGKANLASLALEYSATSAYSVGAIVYHDGNIYQCKTAIAEGGEAWNAEHWELRKLYDFFTESNSLLTGTIDDRLPIPISEKSAGFTTESYKRFVVTVSGDMTVTLHTPTSEDAEIFECRFNGASLSADASITFAGATATTMDTDCGTVKAGKVALMSAFWNGTTWDVNWKVEG